MSGSTTFDYQHVVTWSAPNFTVASGDISGISSPTVTFTDPTPSGGEVTVDGSVVYEYIAGLTGANNNGIILKNGDTFFLFTNQVFTTGTTGTADTSEDLEPVCLMEGTEVQTLDGIKLVENLVIGDRILTANGEYVAIRWIGVQTVSTVFNGKTALPVKIAKDALGPSIPNKDLFVSQNHAVLIDDILFSAIALVNGKAITLDNDAPETFRYFGLDLGPAAVHPVHNLNVGSLGALDRSHFDNYSEWVESSLELIDEPLMIPRVRTSLQLSADATLSA